MTLKSRKPEHSTKGLLCVTAQSEGQGLLAQAVPSCKEEQDDSTARGLKNELQQKNV